MTLLEECRAALPGDWKPSPVAFILPNSQFGQSAMLGWDDLQGRPCRLRVCEVGGGAECALIGNHAQWTHRSGSAAEAIVGCIAKVRASLGPLWPAACESDRMRALCADMAEWPDSPRLPWKGQEVEP